MTAGPTSPPAGSAVPSPLTPRTEPRSAAGAQPATQAPAGVPLVVLTGNPNCGKTTVFNALTGLRAKVGNYAGVTVERKEGRLQGAPPGMKVRLLDLPGTYSLSPQSLDEQIARDVLLNRLAELPAPALVVVVVDASNLQRNLYYTTQIIELGYPTLIALNMMDVAEGNGQHIHVEKLAEALGVPVLPLVASEGKGIAELRQGILRALANGPTPKRDRFCELPPPLERETEALAGLLAETFRERKAQARTEALLIVGNERALASSARHYPAPIPAAVTEARKRLESAGIDWRSAIIESRYAAIARLQQAVTTESAGSGETFSDRLDRVLTHKIWGTVIFLTLMLLMFQSIFIFARLPMDALQAGVDLLGRAVESWLPPGDLTSLLVDGVIAGVGAVVIFLPQILLLFLFIGFLEDTGYMARAAFLMDRLMSKVGLHGKSFIPMLSSFACAIPGIMATRTIESPKDRLVTILVAPLMSCSARLPVYTVLIAACIPDLRLLGVLKLAGLTLLGMYLLGIVAALAMAWLFKRTLLKGDPPLLIMELPPYKRPLLRVVARHMWDRAKIFLRQAGTVILGINILLWFLATYPRDSQTQQAFETRRAELRARIQSPSSNAPDNAPRSHRQLEQELAALESAHASAQLQHSFAGRLGRVIEPLIAPLGFDWKMGIGIISSFAAREVFVSTMSIVYNVGAADGAPGTEGIVQTLKAQRRADGTPVYTALTGLTLMVFYVFALQCASTVAVVRRETNSWKWPLFQWFYLGALAWTLAFITYRVGLLLSA